MNRNYVFALGASACALMANISASAQVFSSASQLAEGKWVKVAVTKTGLYEISYDELSAMGFQNPSKVALFGNGGHQMPYDFVTSNGQNLYDDKLKEVALINDSKNKKIYFYALGTDKYSFDNTSGSSVPYFHNEGKNIYSATGAYFLTDSEDPKIAIVEKGSTDNLQSALSLDSGLSLIFHEEDLAQNSYREGQIFWGEDLGPDGKGRYEWDFSHPDLLFQQATLDLGLFVSRSVSGNLQFGLSNASPSYNTRIPAPNGTYLYKLANTTLQVIPNAKDQKMYVGITDSRPDYAGLDYWAFTFHRAIPTLADGRPQDWILFPDIEKGDNRNIQLTNTDFKVLQISDPWNISEVSVTPFGPEGRANFTAASDNPTILVFDPGRTQLKIDNFEEIENQNIHAVVDEDPELLIITLPFLRHLAEEYADVHRNLEGMRVSVVTAPEVYNEFSGGVPDAMAYRAFVTYLFNNQAHPLKNLLLYGPSNSDMKGMGIPTDPNKFLIAHQDRLLNMDSGAHPDYDIYGCITPIISDNRMELADLSVGVGILSVENETEAEIIRKKLENFITDTSFAYRINKYISLGGEGDNHAHESQAITMCSYFNILNNNSVIVTPISIDAYGNNGAREKLYQALENDVMVWNYFGHGSARMLGLNGDFFSISRIDQLKNTALPLITLAGCDLTVPDRSHRGIGEALILNTPNGGIGAMTATRSSWSGQNMELMRAFHNAFTRTEVPSITSRLLDAPLSIGEVYARTKSDSKLQNELSYILAADPALVIPANLRNVKATSFKTGNANDIVVGKDVVITGNILTQDGEVDRNFNGDVVARIFEPARVIPSRCINTNDTIHKDITYNDVQASMSAAKVENGTFSVTLNIPSTLNRYVGQSLRVVLSAYDPSTRIGGSGESSHSLKTPQSLGIPVNAPDNTAPVISEFRYDNDKNVLVVAFSDETALNLSSSLYAPAPFTLSVDGRNIARGQSSSTLIGDSHLSASTEFFLADIDYGDHDAKITITDAAGNEAKAECRFTVYPGWARLTLSMEETAADEEANFVVSGMVDDKVTLFILDANGKEVFSSSSDNGRINWNCRDNNGQKVAPGFYKAFVRETGSASHKAHSATLNFTVV